MLERTVFYGVVPGCGCGEKLAFWYSYVLLVVVLHSRGPEWFGSGPRCSLTISSSVVVRRLRMNCFSAYDWAAPKACAPRAGTMTERVSGPYTAPDI